MIGIQNHQGFYNNRSQRKVLKMQRSFITSDEKIRIKELVKAKK